MLLIDLSVIPIGNSIDNLLITYSNYNKIIYFTYIYMCRIYNILLCDIEC